MKKVPVLILTGDGINCERETARAFSLVGADPVIVHVNDLLENPRRLHEFEAAAFPGGFSFGDDLGSGQVLALKVSLLLGDELRGFLEAKKPVIGLIAGLQLGGGTLRAGLDLRDLGVADRKSTRLNSSH